MRIVTCPICKIDMKTFMISQIEIDKCPKCEGVWLDKGELEELAVLDKEGITKAIKSQNSAYRNLLDILAKI